MVNTAGETNADGVQHPWLGVSFGSLGLLLLAGVLAGAGLGLAV